MSSMGQNQIDKYLLKKTIGFVGAGNMAQAIVARLLDTGVITPDLISVSAPSENNFAFWRSRGMNTTNNNAEVIRNCEVIILGMKPQYLDEALKDFGSIPTNRLFISILAGISIGKINEKLRNHCDLKASESESCRIIRVMPNTPIMVGAGASVCSLGDLVNPEDVLITKTIFSAGGICEVVPEHLMNAVGALSGSGPAYVYLIIEALCDGAVKMGLPRALATHLACQTLLGGAKMVQETGKHPGQLKDEVCSPGGTTITGIHVLEKSGVRAALIEAIEAATNRSAQLGNKN